MDPLDAALPGGQLDPGGLHELKPGNYGDGPAAAAFLIALAARRHPTRQRPLLWVAGPRLAGELGRPHGPGLSQLGLAPDGLLIAEPGRAGDVLWTLEEGLRSGALAAAVGVLEGIGETAARRLALAARTSATPCLLLSGHARPGLAVAHTRWRIAAGRSAPHPLDPAAPGASRWRLTLERCRERAGGQQWMVEWSDATHAFCLARQLADRPDAACFARRRSG